MQRRTTTRLLSLIAAVIAVLVAGCSSDDTPAGSDSAGGHNSADVAFAAGMIPHHAQAIEMADMALTQARRTAQDPEIEKMSGWLESWGEPVPETGEAMSGMDGSMEGMMGTEDLQRLADSSGAAFDEMWLAMMIEHHQGAISMAETELSDGGNAEAKALADDITDAQQAEIITMQQLLDDADK